MAKLHDFEYSYRDRSSGESSGAVAVDALSAATLTCKRKSMSEFLRWNPELEVKEAAGVEGIVGERFDDLTWYHFGLK